MEQNYWRLGTWGRIPVSMHWTVLIVFAWLYLFFWDLLATLIGAAAFFALLVAHEYGHVFVLRRRKIAVEEIRLYGIHGQTSHAYASPKEEVMVAWGGVAAQALVLAAALAVAYGFDLSSSPTAATIAGPILFVLIRLNIILMVLALLPIGPFDGHAAWKVIPLLRKSHRLRKPVVRPKVVPPEEALPPEKRKELEESSKKAADELIERLSGKGEPRKKEDV